MDYEHHVAHLREEANYEIARLEALLRDPRMTSEERDVALNMLHFYREAMDEDEEKSALTPPHMSAVPKHEDKQSSDRQGISSQTKAA
jgi:hypothetical protein